MAQYAIDRHFHHQKISRWNLIGDKSVILPSEGRIVSFYRILNEEYKHTAWILLVLPPGTTTVLLYYYAGPEIW
jgi:hypothetical protein